MCMVLLSPRTSPELHFTSLQNKITSYISCQFTPHHYTSHHFAYSHSIPTWIPLLVTTFLTFFLKMFILQGKTLVSTSIIWVTKVCEGSFRHNYRGENVTYHKYPVIQLSHKLHRYIRNSNLLWICSRHSDTLRAGRSGDRIPVEARFSAPVQTGSEAHPASYTMGTGSFPGVKRPGRGVGYPPCLEPRLKKELYLYASCGSSWPVRGWSLLYLL